MLLHPADLEQHVLPLYRHAMSPEHVQKNSAATFKALSDAYETLMDGEVLTVPFCLTVMCRRSGARALVPAA